MSDLKTEKRGVWVQIESFKGRTNKQKHNHTHAQKCSFVTSPFEILTRLISPHFKQKPWSATWATWQKILFMKTDVFRVHWLPPGGGWLCTLHSILSHYTLSVVSWGEQRASFIPEFIIVMWRWVAGWKSKVDASVVVSIISYYKHIKGTVWDSLHVEPTNKHVCS